MDREARLYTHSVTKIDVQTKTLFAMANHLLTPMLWAKDFTFTKRDASLLSIETWKSLMGMLYRRIMAEGFARRNPVGWCSLCRY